VRSHGRAASGVLALMAAAGAGGCAASAPDLPHPSFVTKATLTQTAIVEPTEAPSAAAEATETPDPLEPLNRKIFEGNQALNHAVVYPLAKAYRDGVPEEVRDRIDAFTTNLSEPMVLANNVLQLRFDAAATTFTRFVTNSTIGLGGLFDVAATSFDQKRQSGDLGQTLYVWGVRDTAYLVLPVLGPTNVRDGIGSGLSALAPMGIVSVVPASLAATTNQVNVVDAVGKPIAGLGKVEMMEELEASSLDFYVMLRSMSDQKRQAELQEALAQSLLSGFPKGVTVAPPAAPVPASAPVALGGEPWAVR
jgi:phospholipid-binding lipoprotein MlaA